MECGRKGKSAGIRRETGLKPLNDFRLKAGLRHVFHENTSPGGRPAVQPRGRFGGIGVAASTPRQRNPPEWRVGGTAAVELTFEKNHLLDPDGAGRRRGEAGREEFNQAGRARTDSGSMLAQGDMRTKTGRGGGKIKPGQTFAEGLAQPAQESGRVLHAQEQDARLFTAGKSVQRPEGQRKRRLGAPDRLQRSLDRHPQRRRRFTQEKKGEMETRRSGPIESMAALPRGQTALQGGEFPFGGRIKIEADKRPQGSPQ